jgi:hypothetical protein
LNDQGIWSAEVKTQYGVEEEAEPVVDLEM